MMLNMAKLRGAEVGFVVVILEGHHKDANPRRQTDVSGMHFFTIGFQSLVNSANS